MVDGRILHVTDTQYIFNKGEMVEVTMVWVAVAVVRGADGSRAEDVCSAGCSAGCTGAAGGTDGSPGPERNTKYLLGILMVAFEMLQLGKLSGELS